MSARPTRAAKSRALEMPRRRVSGGLLTAAVALLAVPALHAQAGAIRLWTDPVVATAGQPVRALIDVRGDAADWCRYEQEAIELDGGTIVLPLLFAETDPPLPCPPAPEAPAGVFVFTLPPAALAVGFLPLRLEARYSLGGPLRAEVAGGVHVIPATAVLPILGGSFEARVRYLDPRTGIWGDAHAIPLSAASGTFWFFSDRYHEIQIKVLDGRGITDHWWVFLASQTTLEATIEVTHRTKACTTGANPPVCPVKIYPHPAGAAHNVQDLRAFADEP